MGERQLVAVRDEHRTGQDVKQNKYDTYFYFRLSKAYIELFNHFTINLVYDLFTYHNSIPE